MTLAPAVMAMIEALEPGAAAELERVLAAKLHVETTPSQERGDRLSQLIELQAIHGPRLQRNDYDRLRPAGSTASKTLVKVYGSWIRACRAAETASDGPTRLTPLQPWRNVTERRRRPAYTREEIINAVLACGGEIGRFPSSSAYYAWAAQKRRRARQLGAPPPAIPTQRSVQRHFKGWAAVREAIASSNSSPEEHFRAVAP